MTTSSGALFGYLPYHHRYLGLLLLLAFALSSCREADQPSSSSPPPSPTCETGRFKHKEDARVNLVDPFLPKREDGKDGLNRSYPMVWMPKGAEFNITPSCGIEYGDKGGGGNDNALIYYNAAYFGIVMGSPSSYMVRLTAKINDARGDFRGVGLVAWMQGDSFNNFRKVLFLYQPDNHSTRSGRFAIVSFYEQITRSRTVIDQSCDCRIGKWDDEVTLTAYVTGSKFTFIAEVPGKYQIVRTETFENATHHGALPVSVGIEINGLLKATLRGFDANISTINHKDDTRKCTRKHLYCSNYGLYLGLFFGLLTVVLILTVWQIRWAYCHATNSNNWRHGNKPDWWELIASAIAGLQFFTIVGQAMYIVMCIKLGDEEQHKQYYKYLYATVGMLVFDLLYNIAVTLWVQYHPSHKVNFFKMQLREGHERAYYLLQLMSITNLELLALWPWDYEQFDDTPGNLGGYPTPWIMQLAAVPVILQNFPIIIIQIWTQDMDHSFQPADTILWGITGITLLDVFIHFALQLIPIWNVDQAYQEALRIRRARKLEAGQPTPMATRASQEQQDEQPPSPLSNKMDAQETKEPTPATDEPEKEA